VCICWLLQRWVNNSNNERRYSVSALHSWFCSLALCICLCSLLLCRCRLAYMSSPTVLVAACVVGGLLESLTPLSIITGAIMLFQTMHHTKVSWAALLPWPRKIIG
jgi:hypothetical protein